MPSSDKSLDRLNCGIFCDWKPPNEDDLKFIEDNPIFVDCVLGIWPAGNTKKFKLPKVWNEQLIKDICEKLTGWGLNFPHIMIWAKRDREYLDSMLDWFVSLHDNTPEIASLLLDCEKDWHWHQGDMPSEEAAEFVSAKIDSRFRWGVTGLGALRASVAPIAAKADYVVPQAYSIWNPFENSHWSHSRETFPIHSQRLAFDSWSPFCSDVIMGLACYWGNRPGSGFTPDITQEQNMSMCAMETSRLNVCDVWYWSLNWLRSVSCSGEAARRFFGIE